MFDAFFRHFQATSYHIHMESWYSYPSDWNHIQKTYPTMAPKNLGSMGYEGLQTTYIPKPPQHKAYSTNGTALQFYRNWNVSWNQPWEYFASTSSVDSSLLMPCAESVLSDDGTNRRHVQHTGDTDGVVITNASWWSWKKHSQPKYYLILNNGIPWDAPSTSHYRDYYMYIFTRGSGITLQLPLISSQLESQDIQIEMKPSSRADLISRPLHLITKLYFL